MLSISFVALNLVGFALTNPTQRAAGGLTVSLSSLSSSISSLSDLKLTAAVENIGNDAVRVLKYGTVLDNDLPTRSFSVSKDGVLTNFTGIKLQVSMHDLDDSAWVVIPAGETVTAEHDISALYDFSSAGTGTFTFEPVVNFQIANANDTLSNILTNSKINVDSTKIKIEITSDVSKRELKTMEKRAYVSCPNPAQNSFIASSYTEGKSMASLAASYINSRGGNDDLYRSYFGDNSPSLVASRFNAVASENSASRSLNCNDPYGACQRGVIAYTLTSSTNIYFCSLFYSEVSTQNLCSGTSVAARNIRGGTTLHELTHAIVKTTDVVYGCSQDQALSDSQALANADNYNCFATEVYANTRC